MPFNLRSLRAILLAALCPAIPCSLHAQAIPATVLGTWRVARILPASNHACWTPDQAAQLVGTTLRYRAHAIVWHGGEVPIPEAFTRTLTRRHFLDEYKVDLPILGIMAPSIAEIDLQHEDADITGATTEVPGDTILLAAPDRIVVTVCGVFYEALRVPAKPPAR